MANPRFRPIATAPRDGTTIDVRHGPDQVIARAWWAGQNQGFIADNDPLRRTLHRVFLWRPVKIGQGAAPPVTIPTVEAQIDQLHLQLPTLSTAEGHPEEAAALATAIVKLKRKRAPALKKVIVRPKRKIKGWV